MLKAYFTKHMNAFKCLWSMLRCRWYLLINMRQHSFAGHTGKEYIIAFPENHGNLSYAQVLITTMTDTTVTIESPHPGVNRVIKVTAARGATVNLPVSLMLKGSSIDQKGVLIRAPVDISVYVFSQYSSNKGEAYAAIPVNKLGTSYLGSEFNDGFITIIAYGDNTHINITLGYAQSYNGRNYNAGDTIIVYLAKLNTFQIRTTSYIYNTNITSDKLIAVLSGTMCYDQYRGSSLTYCNHMIENIPPMRSMGTTFITPPLLGTNRTYYHSYNNDTSYQIHIHGKNVNYTSTWNRYRRRSELSHIPYVFDVANPGIIVQYTINYNKDIFGSKIIIPAISQYSNYYKYITPNVYSFDNYVAFIIRSDHVNGLRFDNKTVFALNPDLQAIIAENMLYNVISINVQAGQHMTYHTDPNVTFGMVAYGFRAGQAYGFPVGLRL